MPAAPQRYPVKLTQAQRKVVAEIVATVAIATMSFHRPVFVGDEVSCYGEVTKVGNTSITIKVESWVRRDRGGDFLKVTEGLFTFVAIGEDRRPRKVPAA